MLRMSRSSHVVVVGVGLATVVVLVFAAFLARTNDGPREEEFVVNGPVVASGQAEGGPVPTGMVGGKLTLVDGCSRLDGSPVVWPVGTTWNDDEKAIELQDGSLVREGDAVSGGGVYAEYDRADAATLALGSCVLEGRELGLMNGPVSVSSVGTRIDD